MVCSTSEEVLFIQFLFFLLAESACYYCIKEKKVIYKNVLVIVDIYNSNATMSQKMQIRFESQWALKM